jgi:dienelactone hydrolase
LTGSAILPRLVVIAAVLGPVLCSAAAPQAPTIPLPSDLVTAAPAPDVPANVSRFAGAWAHGAWDGVLPHILVVEIVDGAGRAQVVYAVGDSVEMNVTRGYRRVTGRIMGDVLTFDLREGASVAYHIAGNSLRGTYTSRRQRSVVTLARATVAEAMAVPASVPGVVTATTVRIPMAESDPGGQRVTLEAALYRPPGDGPHAVLLFNHGSTGGGTVAPSVTLRPSRQAQFFVERGFAVLAPMRRGRGASQGTSAEYEGTCDAEILGAGLARAIEDVDAAMAYLHAQTWADPERVLVAGQSRGGILSVAYAAKRPDAVRGVINFAGGWTSQRCDETGRGFNQATFAAAGAQNRVPTLWLYAEEDSYYSAAWIRRYHEAFAHAGGVATFHLFPAFGSDGHRLVDRVQLWKAAADDFLRRSNLVSPSSSKP